MPFNNSSISVTNHFYYPLLGHRHKLNSPVHMYTHASSYTQMVVRWAAPTTQNKVFLSHPSASVSFFDFKLFWHAEWLAVYRGFGYWCIRNTSVSEARVCLFMCVSASVKTKRQSSEYFHSSTPPLPRAACQCWPLKRQGARRTLTNAHAPARSASVAVDSEGLVYRGSVPGRPPCTCTCRRDLRPCCTPASLPLSPGTAPAHKHARC